MLPSTTHVTDPLSDPDRLAVIADAGLLDDATSEQFDRLVQLASRTIGAPVCLFSVVTPDEQFFTSQIGLKEPWAGKRRTPLTHSFCQYVVRDRKPFVVENAREHPLVNQNLAIEDLGVVAYAGVPLQTAAGEIVGSLCVIDSVERVWRPDEIATLENIAAAVMGHVELRAQAAAFERERARMEHVIDSSPTVVFTFELTGDTLQPTWVSPNVERVLGYSAAEVLAPGWWSTNVHPEDLDRVRASRRVMGKWGGSGESLEYRFRTSGSSWLWVQDSMRRTEGDGYTEVIATWVDVTGARREREERYTHRLQSLLADAPDILSLLDEEGIILYESPSVERILGYAPDDLIGRSAFDFVHPEDQAKVMNAFGEVFTGASCLPIAFRFRRHDGEWRMLEGLGRNLLHEPEVHGILFSSRDVTEQRALEERLRLGQRMEALGRLAGGVAHDFNNLLTIIIGNAQLACDEADARHADVLHEVKGAAERGKALTQQLLAFSRRSVAVGVAASDAAEVIGNLQPLLARLVPSGVELDVETPDRSAWIPLRTTEIEQVVMNLVINAKDALPAGGRIHVRLAEEDAAPAGRANGGTGKRVLLVVQDNGTGMPEEVRQHIFEPFFTTKGAGEGTGLGLATVFGLVEKAGGSIEVHTAPGMGTRFEIRVPLSDAPADISPETPAESIDSDERGPLTVLVVEDEPAIRRLATRVLQSRGAIVLAAGDGSEALAAAQQATQLDVLVADLMLPDMTGRELAKLVSEIFPQVRVVIASGFDAPDADPLPDAWTFLPKPYSIEELACTLEEQR